jgi:NodT family efflux transporter outer membrane factor (OMF) lipoprotein
MSVNIQIPGARNSSPWQLILCATALAISCSGCSLKEWVNKGFKVGPNYCPPVEPVASTWIDYSDERVVQGPADLSAWWANFNDPVLNNLIQTARFQNLSLREAGARILEYRARLQFAEGNMFPQLQEGVGSFFRERQSRNTANVLPDTQFGTWDVGLNATWELDFWGRFRRSIEEAEAELDASVENYDDVMVLLLSEVAGAYTDLRTTQQRLRYAQANVIAQEGSLKIAEDRLRVGAATERDVAQAKTVLEETRSLIPTFEAGVRLSNNQLCVLLGTPPRDMTAEMGEASIPTSTPEVAVGIPANLVRRRPDVRRAERELAAQSARIGIATTNLYPHFGLNGSIGVTAQDFDDLFDGSQSLSGGFGPYFRWDLLNYGRLKSLIEVEDAQFEQLLWAYQQQVLVAGREAEDGLVTYLRGQERVRNLAASAEAAARALEITTEQYRQGAVDFTPVFLASSVLAAQQDQLATAQGATTQSLIDLYRALGGGWEIRLNRGIAITRVINREGEAGNFEEPPPVPMENQELVSPIPINEDQQ